MPGWKVKVCEYFTWGSSPARYLYDFGKARFLRRSTQEVEGSIPRRVLLSNPQLDGAESAGKRQRRSGRPGDYLWIVSGESGRAYCVIPFSLPHPEKALIFKAHSSFPSWTSAVRRRSPALFLIASCPPWLAGPPDQLPPWSSIASGPSKGHAATEKLSSRLAISRTTLHKKQS